MKKVIVLIFLIFTACSNLNKESNHYFIKGLNYYQKNDKSLALKNYIKAYELNKKDIKILKEIAFLYGDLGNYALAKDYYKKALEIDIYDQNSLENLLNIYYSEKDIENLEKYIEKVLDRNSLFYKYNLLKLTILKKDYALAFLYLENIVKSEEYKLLDKEELYKNYLEIKNNISKNEYRQKMYLISEKLYYFYQDKEEFFQNYLEELNENKEYEKIEKILLEKIMTNGDNNRIYLNLLANFYLDRKEMKKYKNINKIMKNKN